MERIKEHFCWVKLVDGASEPALPAPEHPDADPDAEALQPPSVNVLAGGRPPPRATVVMLSALEPTQHILSGPRPPPRAYGGASFAGWWHVDEDFDGPFSGPFGGNIHVRIRPFIGTRDEAMNWLTNTAEGIAWQQGALLKTLLCFTATGDFG